MKKIISIIVAAVLMAGSLTACGTAGAEGGAWFLLEGEEETLAQCFKDLEDIRNVPLYEV